MDFNHLDIFGTSNCRYGLQFQLVCLMLILLLHAPLSLFVDMLLNLILALLLALLSIWHLFSTNILLNLDDHFLHVLLSLVDYQFLAL
jgi:hypothetical protein